MNASQLDLFNPPRGANHKDLARLAAYLAIQDDWRTADKICRALGWTGADGKPTPNNKRKLRTLAKASRAMVIAGPGSRGYRHFLRCSIPELEEAEARFYAAGKKVIVRGEEIRKRRYGRIDER